MSNRIWNKIKQGLQSLRGLDWHLVLMLGPRHRFSEAQWRLLDQRVSIPISVKLCALLNALLLGGLVAWEMPAPLKLAGFTVGLLMALALLWLAARLWRRPTMRTLYLGYVGVIVVAFASAVLMGVYAGFMRMEKTVGSQEAQQLSFVLLMLGVFGIWVLAMARNEMLASWLREHEQQQRALALAQQLSSAQIQPHFLFNSLASLQHWVRGRDERAAPLLDALTGYLRATLPLFNRQEISLAEELAAVREYLTVMQARLGERLQVEIDVPQDCLDLKLPPALLLTLAENAIEHGVVPKLGQALLCLRARRSAGQLLIEVVDNGPGLPDGAPAQAPGRGIGLANSRERLAQRYGAAAQLSLSNAEDGGCVARLQLPLPAEGAA